MPEPNFWPAVVADTIRPCTRMPLFHAPYSITSASMEYLTPRKQPLPMPRMTQANSARLRALGLMNRETVPITATIAPMRATLRLPNLAMNGERTRTVTICGMDSKDASAPSRSRLPRMYCA